MREEIEKSFALLAESPFWTEFMKRIDGKIKDTLNSLITEVDTNKICRLQGKIQAYRMIKDLPGFMFSKGTDNNPDKG